MLSLGLFPPCCKWTSVWKHHVLNFLGSVQPSLVSTLLLVECLLPVSLHQGDENIPPLRHNHSSFPSAPFPNCKHSLTRCLRLWPLTWVAYGSCSPTDVSVPQSPPGCFLAEWRRSRRVSSGDRARPDPGHTLGDKSLTNTLLGNLSWRLVIYSAHLLAVSCGQSVSCNVEQRQKGIVKKVNYIKLSIRQLQ